MLSLEKKFMFIVLTNIPTPYRTAFFNVLYTECKKQSIVFKVLYCATTEPNRHWPFDTDNMRHPYEILPGIHPSFKSFYPHINLSIINKLKELNPSVLLCAGSWNMPTVWLSLITVNRRKTKTYFWSEGHADAVRNPKGIISKLRQFILKKFDGFAVPNQRSKSWIISELNDKNTNFITLPNTVDEVFYSAVKDLDVTQLRQQHNISLSEKVLVQVSQLEGKKGVIELATAFNSLSADKFQNATLVYLGTGHLHDELKRLADSSNGKIRVLGHVSAEVVQQWLAICDWFVLNTKSDPNPLTPIEACFAAKPIILSVKAGNFYELCTETTGIKINTPDEPIDALTQALETSENLRINMANEANKNILENFTRKFVALRLIESLKHCRT